MPAPPRKRPWISDLQTSQRYDTTTWICLDCARARGFRTPEPGEGHVQRIDANCDYCYRRTLVLDLDDLIPCWE